MQNESFSDFFVLFCCVYYYFYVTLRLFFGICLLFGLLVGAYFWGGKDKYNSMNIRI